MEKLMKPELQSLPVRRHLAGITLLPKYFPLLLKSRRARSARRGLIFSIFDSRETRRNCKLAGDSDFSGLHGVNFERLQKPRIGAGRFSPLGIICLLRDFSSIEN